MRKSLKKNRVLGVALVLAMTLAVLCATLIGASAASAAPITIGTVEYQSLADAVAAASSGDKINVRDNVVLDSDLTIPEGVEVAFASGVRVNGSLDVTFKNNGTVSGGAIFAVTVRSENNGTISGGTFRGAVTNNATISGGTYEVHVVNRGIIDGEAATFKASVDNVGAAAEIKNGNFLLTVANDAEAKVSGGSFSGAFNNDGVVSGGSFKNDITNNGTLAGGIFDCYVFNYGTLEGGKYKYNIEGSLEAFVEGDYYYVTLEQAIAAATEITDKSAGETVGTVSLVLNKVLTADLELPAKIKFTMAKDVSISSDTYKVICSSTITGGIFDAAFENCATVSGGEFRKTVTNVLGLGVISGGSFSGSVLNEERGIISGGDFEGEVVNMAGATISGGSFKLSSTVTNAGEINVAAGKGSFLGAVINNGTIKAGSFAGVTNNKTIEGGSFSGTVDNTADATILGGSFSGTVNNLADALISGGSFSRTSTVTNTGEINVTDGKGGFLGTVINNGTIKAGSFAGVTSNKTIEGGSFSGTVDNTADATIVGGSFSGTVNNLAGALISGGSFSDKSTVNNFGEISVADGKGSFFGKVVNNETGELKAGAFAGSVENGGKLIGGSYTGSVLNKESGVISGGSFTAGSVENLGVISVADGAGSFSVTVTNRGKIEQGSFTSVNNYGTIENGSYKDLNNYKTVNGGSFTGTVNNEGAEAQILGGTFSGSVISSGEILGGSFTAEATVTSSGKINVTNTAFTFACKVINSGEILAGSFTDLDNTGIVRGGSFSGTVKNTSGTLAGGSYTGAVTNEAAGTVTGGVYEASVVFNNLGLINATEAGSEFKCKVTSEGTISAGNFVAADNYGTINGGTFSGHVNNYNIIDGNPVFLGTVDNKPDARIIGGEFKGGLDNYGAIEGGSFWCVVTVITEDKISEIKSGTFHDTVTNEKNMIISGGTFLGTVDNKGSITGGIFENTVNNFADGSISGGTFNAVITNAGSITGGKFKFKDNIEALIVAQILFEDGTHEYYFVSLTEAIAAVAERTMTVKLYKSVTVEADLLIGAGISFEGGEYTLALSGTLTNNGKLVDGIFDAELVNNGSIVGGSFKKSVQNAGTISGGVFTDTTVRNGGSITGGSFGVVTNDAGTITGGSFATTVTNGGSITGGSFLDGATVVNLADSTISGGEFYADVINSDAATISGGTFYAEGSVQNDGTIDVQEGNGSFACSVKNSGEILAGSFTAGVESSGSIAGGSFSGDVVTTDGALITGGIFTANLVNGEGATVKGGSFTTATNNGTIEGSVSFSGHVENEEKGSIKGGSFTTLKNNGTVNSTEGVFNGKVENYGAVKGGDFEGEVVNMAGATISGGEFAALVTNEADAKIIGGSFRGDLINRGILTREGASMGVYYATVTDETSGAGILHGLFVSPVAGVSYEVTLGSYYCVRLSDALYKASDAYGKEIIMLVASADSEGVAFGSGVTINAEARCGTVYYLELTVALAGASEGDVVYLLKSLTLSSPITVGAGVSLDMLSGVSLGTAAEHKGEIMLVNNGKLLGGVYGGWDAAHELYGVIVENRGEILGGEYAKILIAGDGTVDLSDSSDDNMGIVIYIDGITEGRIVMTGVDIKLPEGYTLYLGDVLMYDEGAIEPNNIIYKQGKQIAAGSSVVVGNHSHVNPLQREDEGHHWLECETCNAIIEGSHHAKNYGPASCYQPSTCECGRTVGDIAHSFIPDPDYCNSYCGICGQENTEEARLRHVDEDNNLFCDACKTSMNLLTDEERTLLLVGIIIGCVIIAAAIFILFKSIKNPYGGIARIMKKY